MDKLTWAEASPRAPLSTALPGMEQAGWCGGSTPGAGVGMTLAAARPVRMAKVAAVFMVADVMCVLCVWCRVMESAKATDWALPSTEVIAVGSMRKLCLELQKKTDM